MIPFALGLSGIYSTGSAPPDPAPGQTPLWRALTTVVPEDTITTVNYASKTNFTDYRGEDSFARIYGARYGPAANPSWSSNGLRQAVPDIPGGLTVYARKNMIAETAFQNCGMHVCWFNFNVISNGNFIMLNTGPDTGDSLTMGIGALSHASGFLALAKWDSVIGSTIGITTCAPTSQWIKIWYAWEWTAPNMRWRAWWRTIGGPVTEIGSETSWPYDVRTFCNPTVKSGITGGGGLYDLSGLGPHSFSASGQSAYVLTHIEDAEQDASDIIDPGNGSFTWEVSATAVGGGDGRTLATAWTYEELLSHIADGTIWADSSGVRKAGAVVPVPTSLAGAQSFRDDCYAGSIAQAGHTIRFTGDFYPDTELSTANYLPGVRLTGPGKISSRRTLSGPFTQPDADNYPTIWLAPGSYLLPMQGWTDVGPTIEADGVQFGPIAGASLAAVISDLSNPVPFLSPWKCWVNSDGIYFGSDANPNADGLERVYFKPMLQGLGGYLAMVEISSGVIDSSLTIECGLIFRYEAGLTVPQYALMVVNGTHTRALISCETVGGSYHGIGWIGQHLNGVVCFNGTCKKFCPGPLNANGTTIAVYDPTQTIGNITTVFTPNFAELSSIYIGERESAEVRGYTSLIMHGVNSEDEAKGRLILDGSFKGSANPAFILPGQLIIEPTCTAYNIP